MRRLNSFADDPRAVGTMQRYNALIANNDDYLSNVSRSRVIVDTTDVALQNISEVLADVRVIALRESSALATDQSRGTAMVEVENLINRLMDVLNTTRRGQLHLLRTTDLHAAVRQVRRAGALPGGRPGDPVAYGPQFDHGGEHSGQPVRRQPELHARRPGRHGAAAAAGHRALRT